jgi:hypothetical protein
VGQTEQDKIIASQRELIESQREQIIVWTTLALRTALPILQKRDILISNGCA